MAYVSVNPTSGSLIARGDIITITVDSSTLPLIGYRTTGGGADEIISSGTSTWATIGAGYTGEYGIDGTNYTVSFRRDAGWPNDNFNISVFFDATGAETILNFVVLAEGQYPPDMQPFNDPAETEVGGGGSAIEVVDETTSLTDNVTKFTFTGDGVTATNPVNDEITVAVQGLEVEDASLGPLTTATTKLLFTGAGVTATNPQDEEVTVTISGGGGGSAITVTDEGGAPPLTTDVTSFDFVGDGITASSVGDAVTVNVPGFGGAAPGFVEVVGRVSIIGGVFVVAPESIGIFAASKPAPPESQTLLRVFWSTPFDDDTYFVNLQPLTVQQAPINAHVILRHINYMDIRCYWSATNVPVDLDAEVFSIDITAQSSQGVEATSDFDSVINYAIPQNAVSVPSGFPVQFTLASTNSADRIVVRDSADSVQLGGSGLSADQNDLRFSTGNVTGASNAFEIRLASGSSAGTATGNAGDFVITSGATLSSDASSEPGKVDIFSGAAVNSTQDGGDINLYPGGAFGGGETGAVTINQDGATLFMYETAAAKTDRAGYGQIWVKNDATQKLMFTDEAGLDTDLTTAGGGANSLEGVVNSASPDNDIDIDPANPIIFRDGGASATTPLWVEKSASGGAEPGILVTTPISGQSAILVSSAGDNETLSVQPDGLQFSGYGGADISYSIKAEANVRAAGRGANIEIEAGTNVSAGAGGDILINPGDSSTGLNGNVVVGSVYVPNEISLVQGFTVGETADHPVAPAAGEGQFWVNSDGQPMFTSASDATVSPGTDYDLTAGVGAASSLEEIITTAPIDNSVAVPSANPIIFTDGAVAGTAPLTVAKTGASTTVPNLKIENTQLADLSVLITNSATSGELRISPSGVTKGGDSTDNVTFGGVGSTSTAAGDVIIAGISTNATTKSGDVSIRGGDGANGTSGDGGDVTIRGGAPLVSGTDGDIKIGEASTNEILFGQGITILEASAAPLAGAQAGKGQFWVNDATSPNRPYYTDESGASFDLTVGSGVGDVTSTPALPDNAIVRGDGGVKGIQASAASTLSDTGDLVIENDITAGNDVISTNDITSTVDVNVGVNINVPTGDIIMGAGGEVDGRDVSVDGGVLDGHVATLSGNPHEVEGVEIKSTAAGADLVLTSTAGGLATWEPAGAGDVTASDPNLTNNSIIRGDGGGRGVQDSGILVSDTNDLSGIGNITLTGTVDGVDIANHTHTESEISDLAHEPEGTAVKSTGVSINYVLIADGDDTCSWAAGVPIASHAIGGASHDADTLANFNTKISDSDLTVNGTYILATASDPFSSAVDGDVWIEI
jgi:hypothetical protein